LLGQSRGDDRAYSKTTPVRISLRREFASREWEVDGSGVWLVVYLNINDGGIRQREIEQAITTIKQRHAQSFDGLFVIWKDKLL
jgi:hypothetical protein